VDSKFGSITVLMGMTKGQLVSGWPFFFNEVESSAGLHYPTMLLINASVSDFHFP